MAEKKILIVEDENVQLTDLARRLRSAGFDVVAARDGITAISTARKEQPNLILLDLACLLAMVSPCFSACKCSSTPTPFPSWS